jgi:hypothetical protein
MKYVEDNISIKPYVSKRGSCKGVSQIDPKTGTIINTFVSAAEAARATGADSSTITKVCRGKLRTAKGFFWSYLEG